MLCICRLDHWVPISLCRPFCPVWRPCLWVVSQGSKSRCLGVPWPSRSLPGDTGANRHLAWLPRLFWVSNSHPQSQQNWSWLLQTVAEPSVLVSFLWVLPFACLSASAKKPTASDCEKSSVSLSSSDSESLILPFVAVDSSSSAASSTSEASRLSVVSWLLLLAVDVPCSSLLSSSWWSSSGCQIPSCDDPSSCRSGVSVLPGIAPTSFSLMITSRIATTLRVMGTYTRFPITPSVEPTKLLFSALGSSLLTSLSLFFMKTLQPKIDNLLFDSLGFIPRISSTGHFSSRLTTKFPIRSLLRGELLLPTLSWENPSQWASILPSPAVSSCTYQLINSVVASLVRSSPVECLHLSSTSWTVLRESPSHCLVSLSWVSHTENKLLLAGQCFTLCLKQVHKLKICELVCKHKAGPEPWQWLYFESSITYVNTLSSFSSASVSATLGTGVFVILANAHTMHTSLISPTVFGAFLTTSAWFKLPNRLCHFLALWSFTLLELILISRTLQGKKNYFLVLILPEFPSGVSCSYFFSRKWSYVPTPCILRLIRCLKHSQAHIKHFWVRIGSPFVWGYADPHTVSTQHSRSLSFAISDHWLNGHKLQERFDVRHYVIYRTTVH